jgi:hypothetical protein
MKLKKYRVVAAALCAAFLLCGITTTAYAGGGEEWEDGTGGPEWEGLAPVEPTPAPEPEGRRPTIRATSVCRSRSRPLRPTTSSVPPTRPV